MRGQQVMPSASRPGYLPLSRSEGYISAKVAMDTRGGSLKCPWQLAAQHGQRINVSIVDFHPVIHTANCIPVAYITDVTAKENRTVCKLYERNGHVYLSEGNNIQIQLITASSSMQNQEFLLHYEGNV